MEVDSTQHAALVRLFDVAHEGIYIGTLAIAASLSNSTVSANPHLKRMFGFDVDTPAALVDVFTPERFVDAAARHTWIDRLLAHGHVHDHLLRMRRADGTHIWIEVTATAQQLEHAAGAVAVYALVRDVSERKRSDDTSRDLHQQLLQADKMAALGQTISGVAHELNNPLGTILGWAERLAERPLDPAAAKGVDVILAEAERAARIVRNLLTFARKRQSTRSMINLNEIIRETLSLRAHDHDRTGVEVHTRLAGDLPPIFADGHQIQQVLLNLIINAEQAMRVVTGPRRLSITSRFDAEHDAAVLDVQDSGPGVPADIRSRIFDPFFTTKEVGEGTGLGLAVAYAIMQEHAGHVVLESPPEGGALFRVELPIGVASVTPTRHRPRPAPSLDGVRGLSVLVIEDEQALAAAVVEALTDAGLRVTHAPDGEQGLQRLRAERYDLIICDLKMPRVDGVSVFRTMRTMLPSPPPVIFVTGDVAGPEAVRFLEQARSPWLAKPFRLSDLLRTVRETLTQ